MSNIIPFARPAQAEPASPPPPVLPLGQQRAVAEAIIAFEGLVMVGQTTDALLRETVGRQLLELALVEHATARAAVARLSTALRELAKRLLRQHELIDIVEECALDLRDAIDWPYGDPLRRSLQPGWAR